jgi:hypothetical protein
MSYDDDDSRCGAEFRRWRRQRELELDNQVYGVPAEERPIVEPCRPTEPLTTPALPGNYYAGQALQARLRGRVQQPNESPLRRRMVNQCPARGQAAGSGRAATHFRGFKSVQPRPLAHLACGDSTGCPTLRGRNTRK